MLLFYETCIQVMIKNKRMHEAKIKTGA